MVKLSLLTHEHVYGPNALELLKENEPCAVCPPPEPTALACVLGARWSELDSARPYWMCNGNAGRLNDLWRTTRPIMLAEEAAKIKPILVFESKNGIRYHVFDEFPQVPEDKMMSRQLERLFATHSPELKRTGKSYTFNAETDPNEPFKADICPEWEYEDEKYARVIAREPHIQTVDGGPGGINGEPIHKGEAYWMRVEPVCWAEDRKTGILVAPQLVAGIPFDRRESFDGAFERTWMFKYYLPILEKELEPSKPTGRIKNLQPVEARKLLNSANLRRWDLLLRNRGRRR